jgi:hypothetical protein
VVVADDVEGGERANGTSDVKKRGGVSMIDERRCRNKCTMSREGKGQPRTEASSIHRKLDSSVVRCSVDTQIAYPYI